MKLTIDTKEDSHEEIKKAIKMLATIVGEEHVYTNSAPKEHHANIFESSSSSLAAPSEPAAQQAQPAQNAFAAMFGAVQDSQPSSTSTAEEKKPEKKPEVQIIDY